MTRFDHRWVASLLAGLFLVGGISGLKRYYSQRKEPWREVATLIERYPGSIVYTTRAIGLRTPYFTSRGIDVKRLNFADAGGLAQLTADVAGGHKVWILENFWGGYRYLPELKRTLSGMKLNVSELTIRDEDSPPVLVMEVESTRVQGSHS